MPNGILVDTCTLISYVDETQPHHYAARSYIQHALGSGIHLYLSSLVAAEFSRRQSIDDLGIGNFVPAPFNIPDGITAAQFAELAKRENSDCRTSVLVDIMLIAQAHRLGLQGILTDDADTLAKYLRRLNDINATSVRSIVTTNTYDPVLLTDPCSPSLFTPWPQAEQTP